MKSLILLAAIFLSQPSINAKSKIDPHATFEKMSVDYDITEEGVKGMRIHVSFTTYEMKNMDGYLAIYFNFTNGTKERLKDNNKNYYSTSGEVAVYKSIKPQYDPAVYTDLQVFMPYAELDLNPGAYTLSMDVELIRKEGGLIQNLTIRNFEYTNPVAGVVETPKTNGSATFEKLWLDYDVTENNRRGMRIHTRFSLSGMKNIDSYLAIYFQVRNGEKLKTTNINYQSKSGQVAIYKTLLPMYDKSEYNDVQLFMPYAELNLGSGKFQLTLVADIIYKNGDLVQHLTNHDFDFSQ